MIFSFKKVLKVGLISVLLSATLIALISTAPFSYAKKINIDEVGGYVYCTLTNSCLYSNIGTQNPLGIFHISDDVENVLNAHLIKGKVLKHKETGVMHVADNFEDIAGKIYRDKRTGRYYSKNHLEEVPHSGIMHKHTGEVFISNDFIESIDDIYRHRGYPDVLFSQHDYKDALESVINSLEEQVVDTLSQ